MTAPAEPEIPLSVRVAFTVGSTLLATLLAEGAMRVADGNALPTLGLFTTSADGRITLQADASQTLRRADGGTFTVRTDANGLRATGRQVEAADARERAEPADARWLVVGDSQVLGMGVEGSETFAALAGLRNAGVPGYGVADALAQAEALLPILHPDTVVVIVNQANDWDEGLTRAETRSAVRGGWLVTAANADTPGAWFWSTPLSRVHLLYHAWMRLSPARSATDDATLAGLQGADRAGPTTEQIVQAVSDFKAHNFTKVRTLVAFLPVDAATSAERAAVSPFAPPSGSGAQPWADTSLRDSLRELFDNPFGGAVPLIDLLPALVEPDSFLDGDYHLSAKGHARVAAVLAPILAEPRPVIPAGWDGLLGNLPAYAAPTEAP